jgi:hypothetical protein
MSIVEPPIAEALDEPIVQSVAQRQEPLTAAVGQFIRGERGGGCPGHGEGDVVCTGA